MSEETNKPRVALVSGFDPSRESASGVRTYVLGLAKSLAVMGADVKMIGIGHPGILQSLGVDFISIQERPTTSIGFLLSLIKEGKSMGLSKDVIIHCHRPDDVAALCMSHPENAKVVTLHGSHADSVRINKGKAIGQLYNQIEAYALKRTDGIICVSRSNHEQFMSKYPQLVDRMHLIYAGIDMDIFKPIPKKEARKKLGLDKDSRILLYAGRLVSEKRVDEIIKAYEKIETKDDMAQLVIIGDGKDKPGLQDLVKRLGLRRVMFRSAAATSELSVFLSAADATVIASKQEGLPTIAMESLACGTPVVTTDVGIVREIVKDGINGYIIPDLNVLAEYAEKAISSSSALSSNCVEAVRRFSWEFAVKEIMAVYNEVSA